MKLKEKYPKWVLMLGTLEDDCPKEILFACWQARKYCKYLQKLHYAMAKAAKENYTKTGQNPNIPFPYKKLKKSQKHVSIYLAKIDKLLKSYLKRNRDKLKVKYETTK